MSRQTREPADMMAFLIAVLAAARAEPAAETPPVSATMCSRCNAAYTPSRADSRYCTNACRQAAYRARRGQQ